MLYILFNLYKSTKINTTAETLMIGEDNKREQRACGLPSTNFDHNTAINSHSIDKEKKIMGCNAAGLDEDDPENQQSESQPLVAKTDQNASTENFMRIKKVWPSKLD